MNQIKNQINQLRRKISSFIIHRLWILHGTEKHSGKSLGIIYAGNNECKNYIASIAFDGEWKESDEGKKYLWEIFRLARKNEHSCSMMILNIDEFLCRLIKRKKDFYIPSWVDGEVDIPLSDLNRNAKNELRKIRKSGLEYEVTTEKSALHHFYHDMHLPYVTKRHGNKTIPLKYDQMMEFHEKGICKLMLVKKQGEYISGLIILFKENEAHLDVAGIKDGNQCYFKDGAAAAVYYFPSLYLEKLGYSTMCLGSSRAFLIDGVLQYKKKWGLRLIGKSPEGFLIKGLSACKGLKGFFLKNPFIYMDEGKFCGAVFVENDEDCCDRSLEAFYKRFYINGMSKLNISRFKENASVVRETVPSQLCDKMTIRFIDRSFGF